MQYQRNWAFRVQNPDPPFKDGRPNPHVHWHVMPRYANPVVFEGLTFDDPTFGEPFEWRDKEVPADVRRAILCQIQEALDLTYLQLSPSSAPEFSSHPCRPSL
jgi:hypothetical protein